MALYERPTDLARATELAAGARFTLLAGGTDFYPARVGRAITEDILDLTAIAGLRGVSETDDAWRLGALTTWSDLIAAPLPPLFDGYKRAAREVGGVQIQNTGTIGGNLCNASPAADGTPNLIALDAEVELAGARGSRRLPVAAFVQGNRRTALGAGEILTAIHVPKCAGRASFVKLGARKYLVISIAMAAAVVEAEDGRVRRARIAVGSCSAVAQRLPALEQALAGVPLEAMADVVSAAHLAPLAPITDVRATRMYRQDAALELVRRALVDLA